ncbi:MAG: substrate-binding domain-containing protein, partial [Candidatus Dormibacteraceae bacterium]
MMLAKSVPALMVVGLALMACGGSSTTGSSSTGATVPSDLSVTSFDASFSYMSKLKPLVAAGHGLVGVILPDTTTSARYVSYDLPYLKKAFTAAGYSSSQFTIGNGQGSAAAELALAQADIAQGATVLLMDPADSPTGSAIQQLAASKGVKLISYDRATF